MRAFFQWEDPNMYKIGTIVGVAADSAAIHVSRGAFAAVSK
jgi:hypothetical protein